MLIAYIPGFGASAEYCPVVALSILHQPPILFSNQIIIGFDPPIACSEIRAAPHLNELRHYFIFAVSGQSEARR